MIKMKITIDNKEEIELSEREEQIYDKGYVQGGATIALIWLIGVFIVVVLVIIF